MFIGCLCLDQKAVKVRHYFKADHTNSFSAQSAKTTVARSHFFRSTRGVTRTAATETDTVVATMLKKHCKALWLFWSTNRFAKKHQHWTQSSIETESRFFKWWIESLWQWADIWEQYIHHFRTQTHLLLDGFESHGEHWKDSRLYHSEDNVKHT